MPKATDVGAVIRQNFMDAGFSEQQTDECMKLLKVGVNAQLKKIMHDRRNVLLNAVHQNQQQIDNLDFLAYRLEKKLEQGERKHEK